MSQTMKLTYNVTKLNHSLVLCSSPSSRSMPAPWDIQGVWDGNASTRRHTHHHNFLDDSDDDDGDRAGLRLSE